MFLATIVSDGRIVGVWKKSVKKGNLGIEPEYFRELDERERKSFVEAAERYRTYLSGGKT